MKIAIYDPYLDTKGGGERYMLTLAECLSSIHEVHVLWNKVSDVSIAAERFGLNLSRVKLSENIFDTKINKLKKANLTRQYDVIIFLSDGSIPLVFSKYLILHMQHPVEWIRKITLPTFLKLKRVNKIICNSYFTADYINKKFHVKSTVLYPPVDVKPLLSLDEQKKNTIITVGRFQTMPNSDDFKKIQFMLSVFKKLHDHQLKNWKFIIATSYLPSEEKNIQHLELEYKNYPIEFIHNANSFQLQKLYASASIYWHAAGFGENMSLHPERAEHFGITTVEAMAAGCVPVVFNAGGQKEIVRENYNGLLWNTEEELMLKTLDLINHTDKRTLFAKQAKESSKTYRKEHFCSELHNIIQSL